MFDYNRLGNLIETLVSQHNHAYGALVASCDSDNLTHIKGSYTAWVSTKELLLSVGLTNEVLQLTPWMQDQIDDIEWNDEYRTIAQLSVANLT